MRVSIIHILFIAISHTSGLVHISFSSCNSSFFQPNAYSSWEFSLSCVGCPRADTCHWVVDEHLNLLDACSVSSLVRMKHSESSTSLTFSQLLILTLSNLGIFNFDTFRFWKIWSLYFYFSFSTPPYTIYIRLGNLNKCVQSKIGLINPLPRPAKSWIKLLLAP